MTDIGIAKGRIVCRRRACPLFDPRFRVKWWPYLQVCAMLVRIKMQRRFLV